VPAVRLSRNLYRTRSVKGWRLVVHGACDSSGPPGECGRAWTSRVHGCEMRPATVCSAERGVRGAQLVVFGRGLGQMAIGEQVAARLEYFRVSFFGAVSAFFRSPAPCRKFGPTQGNLRVAPTRGAAIH